MKSVLSLIVIFILVILQSSFYPYLKIYNAFPNLILILVLILSILKGFKESLVWIIFGGLLLDIYSFNNPIGASILSLFIIGYLAYFLSKNIFKKASIFLAILAGIGGSLIYGFFVILVLLIAKTNPQISFNQIISQVLYNTVVLIPIFYLTKHLIKR